MELIYSKHESSNSYWNNEWWDERWYLCKTEQEYNDERKAYESRYEAAKVDYERRGYANYTPQLGNEGKQHASEYYYGHEWRGQNFDAEGFSYKTFHERGSETTYILKPESVKNHSYASNKGCAGWMYGS